MKKETLIGYQDYINGTSSRPFKTQPNINTSITIIKAATNNATPFLSFETGL